MLKSTQTLHYLIKYYTYFKNPSFFKKYLQDGFLFILPLSAVKTFSANPNKFRTLISCPLSGIAFPEK